MSNVKWCDSGQHAFKAGTPGSQSVMGTEIDENGVAQSVEQDVCADCVQRVRVRRAELATPRVVPEVCPSCEMNALVYNKHKSANQCMECGWDSAHEEVKRILTKHMEGQHD